MANIITDSDVAPSLRSQLAPARNTSNVRWGAVVAGVVVASSTWLVLHLLGMGAGMTALDPDDSGTLRTAGIGVGVWSLIAPVLAMFIGGLVTSRLAPTPNRLNRIIHGTLVWSVATLVGALGVFLVSSALMRGVASAGGTVARTAVDAVGAVDGDALSAIGVSADDLVAPINTRLRAEGKPEITAAALTASLKDVVRTGVRTGDVDGATLKQSLARNTALSPRDVEEISGTVEARMQEARARAEELANRAREAALQAAETTGKALLGFALALFLGLAAAIGGAVLTGHHDRRRDGMIITDDTRASMTGY